jgi:hypothetical protein
MSEIQAEEKENERQVEEERYCQEIKVVVNLKRRFI